MVGKGAQRTVVVCFWGSTVTLECCCYCIVNASLFTAGGRERLRCQPLFSVFCFFFVCFAVLFFCGVFVIDRYIFECCWYCIVNASLFDHRWPRAAVTWWPASLIGWWLPRLPCSGPSASSEAFPTSTRLFEKPASSTSTSPRVIIIIIFIFIYFFPSCGMPQNEQGTPQKAIFYISLVKTVVGLPKYSPIIVSPITMPSEEQSGCYVFFFFRNARSPYVYKADLGWTVPSISIDCRSS